jgi:Sulfotransferase family
VDAQLDPNELIARALEQTGFDDLGDIPYREPLEVLVESLNRESGLDADRMPAAGNTIVTLLVKRLRLVDDRKRYPAIAAERITSPIFIVGLPRSGSTHLHALLGQVNGVRTPLYWEMTMPSPPPDRETFATDPRIAEVKAIVEQLPTDMLKRHPIAADRPEQCNMLNDWSLIHQALLAYYHLPSYREWLFSADYGPAFEAHRRTLQHLQWRAPGQWVLKYPKHLIALDVLLATYPDARVVWTHRDPAVVMPSVASFTGYIRASASGAIDERRYGREWTAFEELVLLRGMSVRDQIGNDDGRFYDLHYHDLMADPDAAIAGLLEHFGMVYDAESRQAVQRWVIEHPRTEYGRHEYTPEQFGLDEHGLRRRFKPYIERFGVRPEAIG